LFTLQNDAAKELKLPELSVEPVKVATGMAKFDLTLAVEEWPDGLLVEVEYSADLFDEETIARMLGHFQILLEGIVADPAKKIGELPLLAEAERNQSSANGMTRKRIIRATRRFRSYSRSKLRRHPARRRLFLTAKN